MEIIEWDGDNFLEAFDSGYKFSEADLAELVSECSCEEFSYGKSRWVEHKVTIINFENRLFAINWSEGLTELQENEYQYQPIEVKIETEEIKVRHLTYISLNNSIFGEFLLTENGRKYYL